jgi:hypothetical protein
MEIPHLVAQFHREAVEAEHTQVTSFSAEALDLLYRHDWPGNLRELRNVVFRALVMANSETVKRADLVGLIPQAVAAPPAAAAAGAAAAGSGSAAPPAPAAGVPAGSTAPGPRAEEPRPAAPPASDAPAAAVLAAAGGAGASAPVPAALPAAHERPAGERPPSPARAGAPVEIPHPDRALPAAASPTTLPPRLQRLLALVTERGQLATQEYVEITGLSLRTGLRDLNDLVERGWIERIGSRRGARYRRSLHGGTPVPQVAGGDDLRR